jgi:hypothetical protein
LKLEKNNLLNDIYYSKEYISLYLKENEELFEFIYEEKDYIFYNISIKRSICKIGKMEITDGFYDLETAYGYGGYFVNTNDRSFLFNALESYKKRCKDENIIAEFIRFHPFNSFPKEHKEFLNMNIMDRDVVCVDLSLSKNERWQNYSNNTRNILRKCEKELIFKKSGNLEKFIELYIKTMNKNSASEFYYFDKKYFETMITFENVELYEVLKDEEIISSAFFIFGEDIVHYHLSANNYELRKYNANYFILDCIFDVAKSRNKNYFLLGGGTSSSKDDTLFKFKNKFSFFKKPFYISGKIFDLDIYKQYVKMWEEQFPEQINYFLKYRLEIK